MFFKIIRILISVKKTMMHQRKSIYRTNAVFDSRIQNSSIHYDGRRTDLNTQVRHITNFIHQWAPPGIKMSYDNVGLLLGDPTSPVSRILVCLDVTEEIVDEALEKKCELIVSHHPLIFNKISSVSTPPMNRGGSSIK
jgi:hypothetical protein